MDQTMLDLRKYNFFIGVPDSRLKEEFEKCKPIPAPSEDVAMGVACGAYMAGKKPCVLMQNSGIHVDTILTLLMMYGMEVWFAMSDRGEKDEIQHHHWGRVATRLLGLINETR